jgi:DNA repair exonuclease SbcCD ATPase subunit
MTATTSISQAAFERLTEQVEQLQQRVDELEDENEQLQEENKELRGRVNELEDENEQHRDVLQDTIRALAEVNLDVNNLIPEHSKRIAVQRRELNEIQNEVNELVNEVDSVSSTTKDVVKVVNNETTEIENRIDALERGTAEPVSPGTDELSIETPLENIAAWSQPTADRELSPNQLRARTIASAPRQFCEKIGDADNRRYRISTKSIRKVIQTAHEESIPRETAHRIVEFLDKLGKQWTERRTIRGMTYVVFEAEFIDRLEEAAERNLAASLVDTSVTQGVTG